MFALGALALLSLGGAARAEDNSAAEKIDFNTQIRPLFSNTCFKCHGPDDDERKGGTDGLRLDTPDGATEDLGGYAAIAPGDPDESELLRRLMTDDASELMPPPKAGPRFTAAQVALVRRWIEQGAPYAQHWSYVQPRKAELPPVKDSTWVRNEVDRFLLARLEREGLATSPEADRAALIRRVSLDLTGLPPALDEVDAFLADQAEGAYERLVDRLLKKQSYGEHWARAWLDLARYADSAGYADDPPRTIWAYRDYVIRSLNANKPFDQFTIEQIAGDLLPEPTEDQLIATAFHRNTLTNNEGGTNDEEFRNVAIVDRVNTTMAVWMGTTINCCQCHNHKYDPISQEEFYQLFAILNNTADADRRDESPLLTIETDEVKQRKTELQARIAKLEQQIAADANKEKSTAEAPQRSGPLAVRFVRIESLQENAFLHIAEFEAFVGEKNVAIDGQASQSSTDYDAPAKLANDGNRSGDFFGSKSVTHTKQEDRPWLEIDLGQQLPIERISVWNRTDGNVGSRLQAFRFVALDAERQPIWVHRFDQSPNPSASAELPPKHESLAEQDKAELVAYLNDGAPTKPSPLQKELEAARKQLAGVKGVTVPIMRELDQNRRTTHVQLRGNFLDKGAEVSPGVPSAFHALPQGVATPDRLALARWLVDEKNPLTPRVLVNRYWEKLFGLGIVRTSEEFGSQGEPPEHPELLDWLAADLVEHEWDLKRLVRMLVTSAAYRQSSRVTAELLERDPDNRLLARGPRFRLSAEMIRDQALAVSGLLSAKIYGPPVKPYQPKLGVNAAFGGGIDWQTSGGEDRYRRGLYTTWRRSNPYPSMAAFDAPNREVCTIRRDRTNTPLQALVTLNDPVYIEAAQALARKMVTG
ncbi:MAG: DUF1553 domain-containing protein, partial [Planctomycetales bacterium]|nr:DUF1553 domain-containing protein [Planctomycetales bacterium]